MRRLAHLAVVAASVLLVQTTPRAQSRSLVFSHVTVIDATGGPARPDMTVVISGNRITDIGKKVRVPEQAQMVDATGKFLIPGLWDMHIHIHRHDELALLLANGVTGVRLMAGLPEYFKMRKAIESGEALGPRMVISSRIVDGPNALPVAPAPGDTAGEAAEWRGVERGEFVPLALQVATEAQARQAIGLSKATGFDLIKIHNDLSREAYVALAAESKKQGVEFSGHVPTGVSAAEASDAGQKSIEHLGGILLGCSTREAELRAATEDALSKPPQQRAQILLDTRRKTVESYSADKAAALVARFVRNHTWQSPTLMPGGGMKALSVRNADLIKYLPVQLRSRWQQLAASAREPSSEEQQVASLADQKTREVIVMMQRAGVPFLTGTDTGQAWRFAGFSLHDDLAEMNAAGLTPMEVLQSATRNPARYLGKEKEFGTIQKGKLADLVLLDADPLQQIGNARKINAVVVNGRLLDRRALDDMLGHVVAANAK